MLEKALSSSVAENASERNDDNYSSRHDNRVFTDRVGRISIRHDDNDDDDLNYKHIYIWKLDFKQVFRIYYSNNSNN